MFEELKEKLDELDIDYTLISDNDCLYIDRDEKTRMTIIYDEKYNLCAFYIKNATKDTIGTEDRIAELITIVARYYAGEDR